MRAVLWSAACAAILIACSPPAQRPETPPEPPTVAACNSVAPDAARQVRVEEAEAVAGAAADLRGGAIAPGMYDLVSARRIGAATGWDGARAVALEVSESATGGVTFNWAGAAAGGAVDSWTASFTDTPQPRLTYSCGRVGEVAAEFAALADALTLRLQDGAGGQLALEFRRRV
ncbi:MAG: hypothetical protein ACREH4_05445 [Vitreimonas sp.]